MLAVDNGRTVRRSIKLGLRGERVVEVLDGLAEGELVVPVENARIGAGRAVRARAHE